MILVRLLLLSALGAGCTGLASAQVDTTQQVNPLRSNSPEQVNKPYVILISVDGFRYDYAQKFKAENLLRFSAQGVRAEYMIPSYPSLTFPNHYSLATGLYPAHHGLADNTFFDKTKGSVYNMNDKKKAEDGSWYGGTPLWVLAEQQNMVSASFYWVGSDADVKGVKPTYYYHYSDKIPMERRLNAVRKWLTLPEEKRPHLITFYFPEVDHEGHTFGPDAAETKEAVSLVDTAIGKMVAMTDSLHLPVNFIIVSDHGMMQVDTEHPIPIPAMLQDTSTCRITLGSTLVHVYLKDPGQTKYVLGKLRKEATDYDALLPRETPARWHYHPGDDRYHRIGDLILVSHLPKVFKTSTKPVTPGKHGFDPRTPEMRATFMAWGPQFRSTLVILPFENVNVYPLVAQLLGLNLTEKVDGRLNVLNQILK